MRVKHVLVESMTENGFPKLFGGVVCLDFANTLDGRATQHPEEYLRTYADLVRWAGHSGLLDAATARRLAPAARLAAEAALRTALDLREAIFRVFAAVGRGDQATAVDLAVVQRGYAAAMAAARLASNGAGFGWQFSGDDPDRAWWPVAVAAAGLLTTGPLERIKVCAAEAGCIGLFLDTSKNRSRRWCSMDTCGVEAKVQRQATRRSAARTTG
jgi:predicted RNA-binding Zn ribbon-like protein